MDDKHFYQQFSVLLVLMIVTVAGILILARLLSDVHGDISVMQVMAIEERIKPLGAVYTGAPPETNILSAAQSGGEKKTEGDALPPGNAVAAGGVKNVEPGKETYDQVCAACHISGIAGAPKFGDKTAWKPRIATGMDALYKAALQGLNAMPAKGGRPDLPDADIKAAVDYLVKAAQGTPTAAGTESQTKKTADAVPGDVAADSKRGKETYDQVCAVCHSSGIAGAPKFGDKTAWQPRIATGMDALYKAALQGLNAMPAKGGRPDLPDADIRAAVDYLIKAAQGTPTAAGTESQTKKTADAVPGDMAVDSKRGKETYDQVCAVCHSSGIAGAPKFGDKTAWQPRIATGMDALYKAALQGLNAMPAKGGRPDLPDADIRAAVDYLVKAVQ